MAEDRYHIRKVAAPQLAQGSTPRRPQGPPGQQPPVLLHRRHLLFGAAAAAAATAAGAAWWLGSSGLPEPAGQAVGPEYLAATLKVKPAPRVPMPPDHATWTTCVAGSPVKGLADLDLVLAIDTTGSMGGVINDVKANVAQLIATLRAGGGIVRVGIVAYRDSRDEYVVRPFPLTVLDAAGTAALNGFVASLRAAGGGDWPEKLDAALDTATSMTWRGDVPASIVVIADAPAHPQDQASRTCHSRSLHDQDTRRPGFADRHRLGRACLHASPPQAWRRSVCYV